MHLSVAEAKNRSTLQLLTGVHLVAAESWGTTTRSLFVLLHLVQTGVIGGPAGHPQAEAVLKTDIILSHVNYRTFLLYVQRWFILDAYLHDITPLELTRSNALCSASMWMRLPCFWTEEVAFPSVVSSL